MISEHRTLFDGIESEISALSALRDKPAGTVRITTVEHAAEAILWPAMARLMHEYPDVNVEIIEDYQLTDIVAARYDEGGLVRVLADWCPVRPGYRLYYPGRRHPSPAFALVVDALRRRA